MLVKLGVTFFLVLLNGFFVAAEFAIVKVRGSQIELKARQGHPLAKLSHTIVQHLDAYLSATQLGITLSSLALGWVGESVIAELIESGLQWLNILPSEAVLHAISIPIAFLFITVLHIVYGELAPKSLAIQYPERTTFFIALPLQLFYILFKPFIRFLNGWANLTLKLFGIQNVSEHSSQSIEEIRMLFEEKNPHSSIPKNEGDIIRNVFHSSKKMAKQIMVPHTQVACISINTSDDELLRFVMEEGYSRFPIYNDNFDNILGILHAKDVLKWVKTSSLHLWKSRLAKAYFIPESKNILTLLRDFQTQRLHLAIVVDEFGSNVGIVTLEDILEELIGEIQDEYDSETPVEKLGENHFKVLATTPIGIMNQFLPHPIPEDPDYDTLSGLLNTLFGRIPQTGDHITFENYAFKILKSSKRRIDVVEIKWTN